MSTRLYRIPIDPPARSLRGENNAPELVGFVDHRNDVGFPTTAFGIPEKHPPLTHDPLKPLGLFRTVR